MNTFITWLIYLSSFQGIFLAIALFGKKSDNRRVNVLLGIFLIIVSLTILGRNAYFSEKLDLNGWKLLYFGDMIIFLFGPMLYLLLKQTLNGKLRVPISGIHFLPGLAFLFLIAPYLLEIGFAFKEISQNFILNSGTAEVCAIFSLAIYQLKCHRLNSEIKKVSDFNSGNYPFTFYSIVLIVIDLCLLAWITAFIGRTFFPELYSSLLVYQLIWIICSLALLALGYHALSSEQSLNFSQNLQKSIPDQDQIARLKIICDELESIMNKEKVYLNATLNLDLLTQISGFKKHEVSQALNSIHQMNFFDFINEYRIKHFKTLISEGEHIRKTIIALAFDSGFNSKTTFNVAFKKYTGFTPKEYIRKVQKIGATL